MTSKNSIIIKTKEFPNNIKAIDNLFQQVYKLNKELENRYYLLIDHEVKGYITDLNIDNIKIDLASKNEIVIWAEKINLKVNYFLFLT